MKHRNKNARKNAKTGHNKFPHVPKPWEVRKGNKALENVATDGREDKLEKARKGLKASRSARSLDGTAISWDAIGYNKGGIGGGGVFQTKTKVKRKYHKRFSTSDNLDVESNSTGITKAEWEAKKRNMK